MSKTTNGRAVDTGAKIGRGAVAANGANAKPEKSGGIWHNVTRGDVVYLKSPDGARYYGTAAEVRDAALFPSRRHSLSQQIGMYHSWYARGEMTREELRLVVEDRRRDAIMYTAFDRIEKLNDLNCNAKTIIEAAARVSGMTALCFLRHAVAVAVDRARIENGGKLPYSRYERAALARSGIDADNAATLSGNRGLLCA